MSFLSTNTEGLLTQRLTIKLRKLSSWIIQLDKQAYPSMLSNGKDIENVTKFLSSSRKPHSFLHRISEYSYTKNSCKNKQQGGVTRISVIVDKPRDALAQYAILWDAGLEMPIIRWNKLEGHPRSLGMMLFEWRYTSRDIPWHMPTSNPNYNPWTLNPEPQILKCKPLNSEPLL